MLLENENLCLDMESSASEYAASAINLTNQFSYYVKCNNPLPSNKLDLMKLKGIIEHDDDLYDETKRLRGILSREGKKRYDEEKKNLPGITPSGIFEYRSKNHLNCPSGYFVIDIDNLPSEDAAKALKQKIKADPHTLLCFGSPSGLGLKILFYPLINGEIIKTDDDFKYVLTCITRYFDEQYKVCVDQKCKDVSRLCFLAHDPECFINQSAKPFVMPEKQAIAKESLPDNSLVVHNLNHYEYDEDLRQKVTNIINKQRNKMLAMKEGKRHDTIIKCAFTIGGLDSHNQYFDKEAIKREFVQIAANAGYPEKDAIKDFEDGYKKGQETPLSMIEPLQYSKNDFRIIHGLASLPDLEYEKIKSEKAKELSISVAALDQMVENVRQQNATKQKMPSDDNPDWEVSDDGVFYVMRGKDGKLNRTKVCSKLNIVAATRNNKSENWGILLRWSDMDNVSHKWAMPKRLLYGDEKEVIKELAGRGVDITQKNLVTKYLSEFRIDRRAYCTNVLGWNENLYVLPERTIGKIGFEHEIVYQSDEAVMPAFSESNSLADWKEHVSKLAEGNSRLVFAISAAFAATLLKIVDAEGGGFHFRGESSIGKTTAQYCCASVWGSNLFIRSWNATANGLTGLASVHNDNILILDEIGEANPKHVSEVAYALANGTGRTRATKLGNPVEACRWKILFLSSGEVCLRDYLLQAKLPVKAGQELRFVDIEADAGRGLGLFENIHEAATPKDFAIMIKENCNKYYGTAGVEFIEKVAVDKNMIKARLQYFIDDFCQKADVPDEQPQATRVLRKFALIAGAGEIATELGITGWTNGEAIKQVFKCFGSWHVNNFAANGSLEEVEILTKVRKFFELNETSRFESQHGYKDGYKHNEETKIANRAGIIRENTNGSKEYFIYTGVFKEEICFGFDSKQVIEKLLKNGWLIKNETGSNTWVVNSHGKSTRFYKMTDKMWEWCHESKPAS